LGDETRNILKPSHAQSGEGQPLPTMKNFFPVNFLMLKVSVRPVRISWQALLRQESHLLSFRAYTTLSNLRMKVHPSFLNSDTDA